MTTPRRPISGIKPVCEECGSEKWEWGYRDWVCPDRTKIVPTGKAEELDRPIPFRSATQPTKRDDRKAA